MAKGFTDKEKEAIKANLLEKGKHFFEAMGVKKTSIKDLTEAVGIAQGSFYIFYASKEALCFEIIEQEEAKLKSALLAYLNGQDAITQEIFKEFLLKSFTMIDKSPLIKRIMLEADEYEHIVRRLPEETISKHIAKDEDALEPLMRHWQEMGYIADVAPSIISGAIRGLFMLAIHKKEIGNEIFDSVLGLWCDCLAKGLILKGGEQ